MQLRGLIFRLACNQASRDVTGSGGTKIIIWRGNGALLQSAIFRADPSAQTLITDLSNIVSARVVVRKDNALGDLLISKLVLAADFDDPELDFPSWSSGASQHFTFALTSSDTNQPLPPGKDELKIYFAIEVQLVGSDPITIATGSGVIKEDGIGDADAPDAPENSAWTKPESDARYLQAANKFSEIESAGAEAQATAREHLGLTAGALINQVAVPEDQDAPGQPGDFACSASHLYLYVGNGSSHAWLQIAGAQVFSNV